MSMVRFEKEGWGEEDKVLITLLEAGVNTITEKQVDPAIEIFNGITDQYPTDPQAYFYLANLHTIKDQKVEALKNYELAWKLGKDSLTNGHIIPYQAIFLLVSERERSVDELSKWVVRTRDFYDNYSEEKRKLIDFANQMI